MGLTAIVISPGPHRDWIFMMFFVLHIGIATVGLAVMLLNADNTIAKTPGYLALGLMIVGVCGTLARVRRFLIPADCPACGRKALLHAAHQTPGVRTYHDYYWCLHCSDRFKRLENGPWEKAWSPHDDRFYWLWSSGRCFDV